MAIPELNKILPAKLQLLVPAAMGLWGIWNWVHSLDQTRRQERVRMAALYVNPFLSACEDLQSRIYNILQLDGLRSLRERYSDGAYADETLYIIVRYFGWVAATFRYGPYTQDPDAIRLAEGVRRAFSVSNPDRPPGPFNFFTSEQKALGKMVMHRMRGQYGVELDTISFYEFRERLASAPLSESEAVGQSLEALRNARGASGLSGRERLEEAQNYLVDLLNYLEAKEGYTLFSGQRMKCAPSRQLNAPAGLSRAR